jgi:acetyl-CoA carboxylase biotin carboxyl carrier protein
LDLAELKEILRLLHEKDIAEFELEEEGMKLRIRKAAPLAAAAGSGAGGTAPNDGSVVVAASAGTPRHVATPAAVGEAPPEGGDLVTVKSPIVGTFYRSPAPSAPAFVDPGDHVKVGQVLCIVEAMKLMNEIESEMAGEVVKIHVENGQPVQYGEVLFTLRPSR